MDSDTTENNSTEQNTESFVDISFKDCELSCSNSVSTQTIIKLCKGYVPESFNVPVWESYPFQLFSLNPTNEYILSNGSFHAIHCYQGNFYLTENHNENLINNICLNLKYSKSLKRIVERSTETKSSHMPYDYLTHQQLVNRLKEKDKKIMSLQLVQFK